MLEQAIVLLSEKHHRPHESEYSQPTATETYLSPYLDSSSELDAAIANKTLLTLEQEKRAFVAFDYLKYKVYRAIQDGEKDSKWLGLMISLRNKLVCANLQLVSKMIDYRGLSPIDNRWRSEGSFALLKAVDGFNPWMNVKFSTYACRSILNLFTKARRETKVQFMDQGELENVLEDSEDFSTTEFNKKLSASVKDLIVNKNCNILTKREKMILGARYGFIGKKYRLNEVGDSLGLTAERVRQIQLLALNKIKQHLIKQNANAF